MKKALLTSRFASVVSMALVIVTVSAGQIQACPACYGDTTDSKMGNAASWGIIAMVIIMFGMLGTLTACGFYLNYRAKHPLPDYSELLKEGESQSNPSV